MKNAFYVSMKNNKNVKIFLYAAILSISLSVLILRNYVFASGFIPNSESIGGYPFFSERVSYLWDELFQSGNRVELALPYLLFSFLGARISYFLVLTLMGIIAFFVATKFTEEYISGRAQYLIGSLATIFYMTNPIMGNEIFRISFVWSMAWVPLLFYMAFQYLKEANNYSNKEIITRSIYLAIIFSLIVYSFWIIASVGLLIFCFVANMRKPLKRYVANSFKISIFLLIFYCLLCFWWIFPYSEQLFAGLSLPVPYVVTWESAHMLSWNASILNVFRLMWYWVPYEQFIFSSPLCTIYDVATVMVPLIMFSTFLFKKDRRTLSIGILTIFLLIFGTGLYYFDSFGKFYGWVLFNFPIWFPRVSGRWLMMVTLFYMLLFSIFSAESFRRISIMRRSARFKKTAPVVLSIALLIPITIVGLPLTLNAPMTARSIPDDYNATNNWLEEMEGDFKVLAIPDKPFWGYSKPTITWSWLAERVQENKISQLNKLTEFQNVKYVLVDGNILDEQQLAEFLSILENQENLEFCKKIGSIHIFESTSYSGISRVIDHTMLVQGGLEKLISLTASNAFDTQNTAVILLDQNINMKNLHYADIIALESSATNSLILSTSTGVLFITPFTATDNHNPSQLWSKAGTDDPLHGPWHSYLESRGLDNWDFDYGKGLVFTWAPSKLENPAPTTDDLINQWTFDLTDDVSQWQNYTPETQSGALQLVSSDTGALKAELWNSTSGWKTINSPIISAEYSNWYRWELQVKSENAKSVHIKIAEYDQKQKIIGAYRVGGVYSGNLDWQTTTIDYTPENPETRYIQLQVWHGHETTQPLPNKIWVENVKVYDLQKFVEPISLEIPFTISETGEYVFLTRLFQNQQGGKIQIQLDDQDYQMNTKDPLNKFTWEQIDTLYIQKGQHKMTLSNLEGFNALNLFAIVPKQQYQAAQNQLAETLQNKRLIYILEAESDLYRTNAATSSKYNVAASNGKVLELAPASETWNELEILKTGDYTLAIRSEGNVSIKIDEKTYLTNSATLDWAYIGPIALETGIHKIEIVYPTKYAARWAFENGEPIEWTDSPPKVQTLTIDKNAYEEGCSLKAELNELTWGWKTVNSPLIQVIPATKYGCSFLVAGENSQSVHAKIVEYDINQKRLTSKYMKSIGSGNFTWTQVTFDYTPSENASYIQLQVWHGHETTQPLPNKIWLDNVKVYEYSPETSDLDVVWLFSTHDSNVTLENVFANEASAEVISYRKINPTKYVVTVNATAPFMLSFAEAYDPLWVAYVNGERIMSVPVFSVINGFWVDGVGVLEVTVEYAAQGWFFYGCVVSVVVVVVCVVCFVCVWLKRNAVWKSMKTLISHTRLRLYDISIWCKRVVLVKKIG